jgi:heme-degrading monooxygenase HmoA
MNSKKEIMMTTARVITIQVIPDKVDEFVNVWHSRMAPNAQKQPGWQSARLLVNRQTGKVLVVGIWTTEAEAQASGTGSEYAERQMALLAGLVTAPPVFEHYEVASDV